MAMESQGSASPQGRGSGRRTQKRRRRRKRMNPFLYMFLVIAVSAILAGLGWLWAGDVLALNKSAHTAVITVTDSDNLKTVTQQLKENGLIEYKLLFRLFCAFTHVEEKEKIVAGTYELNTDMDYNALINAMSSRSGSRKEVSVTIPEGYNLDQIFELLVKNGVSNLELLREVSANYDFKFSFLKGVVPLGDYHRLEGYLFPDTYKFYMCSDRDTTIQILNKMILRFDQQFTDALRAQAEGMGYSVRDILTIASLIEKETDGTDRGKIASVIYNRLEHPDYETVGKLDIDAALVYVLGRSITQADYDYDHPYNTYVNKGLPPGPIASPGMASLKAALNPESTNNYYYVLGNDGQHHFFRTHQGQQDFIAEQQAQREE